MRKKLKKKPLEKELKGDIFNYIGKCNAICITTNGFVKRNGELVMGKGNAGEAAKRYPELAKEAGWVVDTFGNSCNVIKVLKPKNSKENLDVNAYTRLVIFPTKPDHVIARRFKSNIVKHAKHLYKPGDYVPGYHAKSDINLIKKSALRLKIQLECFGWSRVIIPKPGCSNGELDWEKVKQVLKETGLYDMSCVHFIEKG